MIAADDASLFRALGCEWNRNSASIAQGDVLAAQFDACAQPYGVRAWNGPPNPEKARRMNSAQRLREMYMKGGGGAFKFFLRIIQPRLNGGKSPTMQWHMAYS